MRQADQLVTACTKFILANQAHKRKLKFLHTTNGAAKAATNGGLEQEFRPATYWPVIANFA
ncbi:MAG TPA: hypothetical protein VGW12_20870 [Pyrinomonadaceae bacterium]|nr:hypothetical protein [Pyrinomonadaceae bacterium]